MDLTTASLTEIRDSVRTKKVSAAEVTQHFLTRIDALDKTLNSFITVNPKALDEAKAIDQKIAKGQPIGALAGIPVAIKDLICTEGLRTTAGSKMLSNFIPPYSATLVRKLQEAGTINLGKTNLDEFAMGSSTESSAFGLCRNPWNTDYVPGGSSGGSAAALAAHLAPAAIGTDTGGSIRQPSSFCGVYGIKPTYGRVSRYGIIAYASSLDQAGPMAHSTKDCALMLEAISGECGFDSTSAHLTVPKWSEHISADLSNTTIGLPKEYFGDGIDADTRRTVDAAIAAVRERGAKIIEVSLPLVKFGVPIYYLIATSEASSNLARYDGIRYGHRADFSKTPAHSVDEVYSKSRAEGFGTEVKRRIVLGTYALSSGYYDAYYQKACQVRRLVRGEFLQAFEKCDVLLSPVTASPAFKIGGRVKSVIEMYLNDIFTTSTNLAGLPGMSVPAGFSHDGLPIGVQLTAKHFDEQRIFNVSQAIEQTLNLEKRRPHVI